MIKISLTKLRDISQSAKEVLDAIAGDHEYVSPNDSSKMCRLWDDLNDRYAPPAVVKAMADELINLRKANQRLQQQRVTDRRRFSNPAPESLLTLVRTANEECTRCNADGWRADEMGMITCSCSRGQAAHQKAAERHADHSAPTYFAFSPDYGFDFFKNKQDAINTAQEEIDGYRKDRDDGWSEDVRRVAWGVVVQQAQGFDAQGKHHNHSEHTYQTCEYRLEPPLPGGGDV